MTRRAVLCFAALVGVAPGSQAGRLPRDGGELRVQLAHLPATRDPRALGDDDGAVLAGCLYEGLTAWGDGEPQPALARDWARDDDGRRWSFALRADATFHDGSRCDAAAVRQSLQRLADPRESPFAWILSDLLGWDDFSTGRTAELEGLLVVDAGQIELRFAIPVADLPARLALPVAGIARRAGPEWLGTGPFRFESAVPGEVRLVAFEAHRAGRPHLDRIILGTRRETLGALAGAPAEMRRVAPVDLAPGGMRVVQVPAERLAMAVVSPHSVALADEAQRQRLAEAFDGAVFVQTVLGGDGHAARGLAPGAPRVVAPRSSEPPGDLATRPQQRARLVVPAGEPVLHALGERLQAHLFALGVQAELSLLPDEQQGQVLASRSWDLALVGWTPPQPGAGVLESATRARVLLAGVLRPMLGAALPEGWDAARLEASRDPDGLLTRGARCIPLVFFHEVWLASGDVLNLQPGRAAAGMGLADAHLDPSAP